MRQLIQAAILLSVCVTFSGCWIFLPGPQERLAIAARHGGEAGFRRELDKYRMYLNLRCCGHGRLDSLEWAIEHDRRTRRDDPDVVRAIEVLIAAGADVNGGSLHRAAFANSIAATTALIGAGADVNAMESGTDQTPLDRAVEGCLRGFTDGTNQRSDVAVAATIAEAGGRLNVPVSFEQTHTIRWVRTDSWDEAPVGAAIEGCYPKEVRWATRCSSPTDPVFAMPRVVGCSRENKLAALTLTASRSSDRQELLKTADGVSLYGVVRLVQRDAATCHVDLEEEWIPPETMQKFDESLEGQPFHLWEVIFSVSNGSNREIEYLNAHSHIDPSWSGCTELRPHYELEGNYSGAEVEYWSATAGILHPGGARPMPPGQTESETVLLMALHGNRPRFSDWNVTYTFEDPGNPVGQ